MNQRQTQRWSLAPAVVFALLPLWMLTYPFDFASHVVTPWLRDPYPWVAKLNTLSNVIMMLPFGVASGWWLFSRMHRTLTVWVIVASIAGGLSLLGETLQVWLPDRHSSIADIVANVSGAVMGAWIGCRFAASITHRWQRTAVWLAPRPRSQTALWMLIAMCTVRLAPFMFNVETFYLKQQWRYTIESSWPPHVDVAVLAGAALSFVMLGLVALTLSRAMRETFEQRGDRGSPAGLVVVIAVMLALATEFLQWPIRGRVMDVVDAAAAMAGVLGGLAVDTLLGPIGGRMRRAA